MRRKTVGPENKRLPSLLLCFILGLFLLPLGTALADNAQKAVRVGWYDSSYNTIDAFGRRSGYAYEYQLKIAAFTGWSYEYVTGSWSELLGMLINGKIDMLSDVSYTPERAKTMLFPELPMGEEEYYLFMAPSNRSISSADISTLNGKRIGVNRDSIQAVFFREWEKRNGIETELVELANSEDKSLSMLETGELDGYVTVDSFTNPDRAVPVVKVGSSDFFFAVNKDRPDLLKDLNNAMSRIQDENRYFNQQMFERYMKTAGANAFLSANEQEWLSEHGTIRVGYQDNYLAFCAADKTSGELTGAMKDYLDSASACLENARLSFSARAYPTMEGAVSAMKNGEVDCVFPANLSGYDGEKLGIVMTPPLVRTDVYAVVRESDLNIFTSKELPRCTGMNLENSLAYDNFINDLFTDLKPYIEKTFSVKKGRMNTAITGFSMGGRESMFIGFQRPEEFGYLGAVCPAPGLTPLANSAAHPGQMKDAEMKFEEGFAPRFFLLTAGQSDRTVRDTPVGYHNTMVSNGVKHLWSYLPNADHNETSVKPHLYQFFQLVFQ